MVGSDYEQGIIASIGRLKTKLERHIESDGVPLQFVVASTFWSLYDCAEEQKIECRSIIR